MSFLDRLLKRSKPTPDSSGGVQAVLVYLDGSSLPDEVYEQCDLATLEDRLAKVINEAACGEYDGNEFAGSEVVLYCYGPDAERLLAAMEPVLRDYPLCQNARVIVRAGEPGAPQRELRLPAA